MVAGRPARSPRSHRDSGGGPVTLPAVIDEAFFLTVAGIAMSFAGFAGLMNALRRRGESWAPIELYQLSIIVAYAITSLLGSLSSFQFVELLGLLGGVLGLRDGVL